jgi:proline dehydrogenase
VYLDRTGADIQAMASGGVRVRLVKGAYQGDTRDYREIQDRMRTAAGGLLSAGRAFAFATHDPDLIAWLRERTGSDRETVEFGFLMGLSDRTKEALASGGWRVCEYVPFGPGGRAYVLRRERYLRELERLGRSPAP